MECLGIEQMFQGEVIIVQGGMFYPLVSPHLIQCQTFCEDKPGPERTQMLFSVHQTGEDVAKLVSQGHMGSGKRMTSMFGARKGCEQLPPFVFGLSRVCIWVCF